jgi:FKBP-type peptidyl-prolyl cis-trans isomerase SlyD
MDVSPARAVAASLPLFAAVAIPAALTPALTPALAAESAAVTGPVIARGKKVDIEYTLTLDDGSTVQTNAGGKPLSFVAGEEQLVPGLELALQGKSVNDRVKVRLTPEQAYGNPDPALKQEVPLDKIPEDARKVGTLLSAQGDGGPMTVRVTEVRPDVVVLDFNHPLAGKALTFDVLVLSIN